MNQIIAQASKMLIKAVQENNYKTGLTIIRGKPA